jgi:tRNA uracil 4-sulfurtransferase
MADRDTHSARSCGQDVRFQAGVCTGILIPGGPLKQVILAHYHEINLKGNNRGWFENRLHTHVQSLLQGLPHEGVRRFHGRLLIALKPDAPVAEFERRMRWVSGIANFSCAWEVPADLEAIRTALVSLIRGRTFATFKIDARRGTKDFPLNSQELNQTLGEFILERTGAGVRMENPDLTCYVEIVGQSAFLYFAKTPGGGGLPSRTGGKVLCLLSGGIDSPVAAFRMLRRGCQVRFVHYHSFPHTTAESQEKVRRIVQLLGRYQLQGKLYLVPFADVQREIVAYTPPPLRVILYRRFMVRIAEELALKQDAGALVTGDSLGQVASQTLENLRVVSAAARSIPIFRPLIGDDKEDIIRIAREIETYDISIQPDQDCCTLFVPKHPETMARAEEVERAESALDLPRLTAAALSAATTELINPDFAIPNSRMEADIAEAKGD